MNIWKTTLLLVLLFTGITVHAQKVKISLNSDGNLTIWKVKAQAEIEHPSDMMTTRYDTRDWVKATVPGTVFGSYVLEGLEPDPNFADNAYKVDKAKYDRNFWYRTEFNSPEVENGERVWLNFEGVNRKGEIFFNGTRLGLLDGFMHRGNFDITDLLSKNGKNVLAVLVHWVGTPVPNYASPTYMSCAGWDWMPYVPGLLTGITDDVYLTKTGEVSIVDPWIRSKVPSKNKAVLSLQLELRNHTDIEQKGVLKGIIQPGNIEFTEDLVIEAGKQRTFLLDDSKFSQFIIQNPALWWPNGYGQPNLYTCELTYMVNGKASDKQNITFGIREYGSELVDGVLHLKINGEPVYVKGGNWGMDDAMKRVSREHLEPYFRLHKEANFNMIRNWTGESTEENFYELCDEYGMLVFNDFWLSTQGYNMPINDDNLFLRNAEDVVVRFRNHPSIAVWNPRNEGFAPVYIEEHLAKMIAEKDGTRYYSPNSTHCNLRPSGPWNYHKNPVDYYRDRAHGFNTEQGSTSIPTEESILAMMDVKDAWPISDVWYYHDLHGGQREFMEAIDRKYGKPTDLKDFSRKAQIVNYDSHRAMMEAWNSKMWNSTSGLLLWMSHPAWPSMVWQIYSWDYETFGSFYGCRKACEPIHIQKNLDDQKVVVVNTSLKEIKGAKVIYEVYSLEGKSLFKRTSKLNVLANGLTECFVQDKPISASGVYMERLILQDKRGKVISINDYWQDNGEGDFQGFNALEEASINCKLIRQEKSQIQIELQNTGAMPALALKLNVREADTDKRILPAYASDGYFNLLPGEKRTVTVEYVSRGKVAISAEGYNLKRSRLLTLK